LLWRIKVVKKIISFYLVSVLKLSEFDFDLPAELIAQEPAEKRDESRLMVLNRKTGSIDHLFFHDITDHIQPKDLLVLNNTRVFPARLIGRKEGGKASIEVFLLREIRPGDWEVLLKPARRVPPGSQISFCDGILFAEVLASDSSGKKRYVRFSQVEGLMEKFEEIGEVPLPPYINRPTGSTPEDRERYQTVYASHKGSVAAPTAGLHFTRELLAGIRHCYITLHVGYGTFKPVTVEDVEKHEMEEEHYSVTRETAAVIREQRENGRRIIATGTTTARTLEAMLKERGEICAGDGKTSLFIYPGYRFQAVDSLLTNFHLPKSTLLMLVSAFGGTELVREAYREAVAMGYRFYSYGDAMLIE
jgi:S-adenosylmethionine:tRNA ribosyltransferase-isomerase